MKWEVVLTPEFQQEVRDIYTYIANTLLVPEAATKLVRRILDAAGSLEDMPTRHSLYEKEPWRSRGLRKLAVSNFLVLYITNEKTHEVVIFHVFYGGRNIEGLLGFDFL